MSDEYALVNAYDSLVREQVKLRMENEDMCRCEKCFLDVCAIVFNRGYVNFVTTRKGQVLAQVYETKTAGKVELAVKIMDAIQIVKGSPKH